MSEALTHYDAEGHARMVDVSGKPPMAREAVADACLVAAAGTIDRVLAGELPKGEALAVARVAGIQAAKRCAELIPLCHPLPLNHAAVDFERAAPDRLRVVATTRTIDRTGVEMEALCAASIAALTLWDMVKGVDAELMITDVTLCSKTKIEV
jgi:cyclic pyranopterin phosphate synthase